MPHHGTKAAWWASLLAYTSYWRGSSTALLELMFESGSLHKQLHEEFHEAFVGKRPGTASETYIKDFYESRREKILGLPIGVVCLPPLTFNLKMWS